MVLEDWRGEWDSLDVGAMLRSLVNHLTFTEGNKGAIDGVGAGNIIDTEGAVVYLICGQVVLVVGGRPPNPGL